MNKNSAFVQLDLNNPAFQTSVFCLQKPERLAVLNTLEKLSRMTWEQVYRDKGLRWEKISSVTHPKGVDVIYSLRITQSRRATAYREGNLMRFLLITPDHDSTYIQ